MTDHAIIAPSSLARTVQCPGSVAMQRRYPEAEGPEGLEGTAAHWVLEQMQHGQTCAVGQVAPNGVVVTDEMIEGADLFIDALPADVGLVNIEQRVICEAIHECWGTPDWFARLSHRRVQIRDYKFGHGFVEAYRNWQGVAYASGVLRDFQLHDADDCVVEFIVVQPRNYHPESPVRKWSTTVAELRPLWAQADVAARVALSDNPPTIAGPECKHCTARHACPTLASAALDVLDDQGKSVPLDLPTPHAAAELRRLDYAAQLLDARRSGLEQQLLRAASLGEPVPFFHVEHGNGREAWAVPSDQVLALGDLYGVDLAAPREPITPFQARKKGVDVPGFSKRDTGAAKLVADSPHRAAKIFARPPQ